VQFALIDDAKGILRADEVLDVIDAEHDHQPHVAIVAIENTHMLSGGTPWELDDVNALKRAIGSLPLHLDGARLFNASVATGISASDLSAPATTVTACLSKGLGAPVGSLLAGPTDVMHRASIERRRFPSRATTLRRVAPTSWPLIILGLATSWRNSRARVCWVGPWPLDGCDSSRTSG